jgi:hypothetical protein
MDHNIACSEIPTHRHPLVGSRQHQRRWPGETQVHAELEEEAVLAFVLQSSRQDTKCNLHQ